MSVVSPTRRRLLAALFALPFAALGEARETERPAKTVKPKPKPKQPQAKAAAPRSKRPAKAKAPPPSLNAAVGARVTELRRRGLIGRDETAAFYVQDLRSGQTLLSLNGGVALQAASMIKPFVAAAYFSEVMRGRLRYTPAERTLMEAMIVHSDNTATNHFIRAVGGPARVQVLLRRIAPGVVVSEYIPAGGRTYRNRASCQAHARFLDSLWKRRAPGADEILRVMRIPNRDRLYEGADGVTRGTAVYDKTGTTARLCGDMGILVARQRGGGEFPYAIIGVVQRRSPAPDYGQFMVSRGNAIREVSSIVYQELRERYGLV